MDECRLWRWLIDCELYPVLRKILDAREYTRLSFSPSLADLHIGLRIAPPNCGLTRGSTTITIPYQGMREREDAPCGRSCHLGRTISSSYHARGHWPIGATWFCCAAAAAATAAAAAASFGPLRHLHHPTSPFSTPRTPPLDRTHHREKNNTHHSISSPERRRESGARGLVRARDTLRQAEEPVSSSSSCRMEATCPRGTAATLCVV